MSFISVSPETAPTRRRITLRSILLSVVTIVSLHVYTDYAGLVMGSSSIVDIIWFPDKGHWVHGW